MPANSKVAPVPAPASDREMVVSRVFDAPRELVWQAWTTPEHIVKWCGPYGFTTIIDVMDLRPGGEWRHIMHGPDGTDYPNRAVFHEVVKPERIVLTNTGARTATDVQFESSWTFEVAREYGAIEGGHQTLCASRRILAEAGGATITQSGFSRSRRYRQA